MPTRCVLECLAHSRCPALERALTSVSSHAQVPLYALLLFSSGRISMELDRGVTVHLGAKQEQWVHLRAWPRIGVLVNGLRKLFDGELEAELEEPGFGGASLSLSFTMVCPR